VLELIGIDHGADRLHQAVGDVEREDASHSPLGVVGHRAGLAVDQGQHAVDALLLAPAEQSENEPGNPFRPVQRLTQDLALAAAVADRDHVRGEQAQQRAQVPAARRLEETAGYLVTLLAGGVEPGLALVNMAPGADEDLPAVRLGLACDLGDLGIRVAEDLVQEEHGTLGRRQAFEQDEERHGQGIGHFGALRGIIVRAALGGDERLGQPGAHVGLPPDPG
jgi:hypothetical protein